MQCAGGRYASTQAKGSVHPAHVLIFPSSHLLIPHSARSNSPLAPELLEMQRCIFFRHGRAAAAGQRRVFRLWSARVLLLLARPARPQGLVSASNRSSRGPSVALPWHVDFATQVVRNNPHGYRPSRVASWSQVKRGGPPAFFTHHEPLAETAWPCTREQNSGISWPREAERPDADASKPGTPRAGRRS